MKPILIHCHIYYPHMWPELKECIHNIEPHPFKLFVTLVEKHNDIWHDILTTFPNAHIEVVENRGYDVGPFIHILNQVDLDEYSYIVKLHTKRDIQSKRDKINNLSVYGSIWRDKLLSPFKSKEIFAKYISAFETNEKIGMQSHYTLQIQNAQDKASDLINPLRRFCLTKINYLFVAGTMFIARANIFKSLQSLNISLNDFEIPKNHCGELAHEIERLMGYIVYQSGYICFDGNVLESVQTKFQHKVSRLSPIQFLFRFLFQYKTTRTGKKIIKIFRIPVFVRKVK